MDNLNEKQKSIYDCIKYSIRVHGYPPTVRELSSITGISSTATQSHLRKLEQAGYIKRDPSKPRAIELANNDTKPIDTVNLPIIEHIDVNQPLYFDGNINGYLPTPSSVVNSKESFLLKVNDDSMINAHILRGDIAIVNVESNASDGDIVVVFNNDSATIKRFYKEDDHYRLQPENDTMEPIIVRHVEIIGKVIGVLRLDM